MDAVPSKGSCRPAAGVVVSKAFATFRHLGTIGPETTTVSTRMMGPVLTLLLFVRIDWTFSSSPFTLALASVGTPIVACTDIGRVSWG